MLSSKARILWIKWHAYLSCFFLPFALLYSLTGILYLLDFKGSETVLHSVFIETDQPLPETELSALEIYESALKMYPQLPIERPENFWHDDHLVSWWHFQGEVLLLPTISESGLKGFQIRVEEYNFLKQLHFIHKGLAGLAFKVFGIFMGLSLLISIITGAVIALVMPKLKRWAVISSGAGMSTLIMLYVVSYF